MNSHDLSHLLGIALSLLLLSLLSYGVCRSLLGRLNSLRHRKGAKAVLVSESKNKTSYLIIGSLLILTGAFSGLFLFPYLFGHQSDAQSLTPSGSIYRLALGLFFSVVLLFLLVARFLLKKVEHLQAKAEDYQKLHNEYEKLSAVVALVSGALHKLNSPLMTMGLVCEDIIGEEASSDSLKEEITILQGEISRCTEMLSGITKDFSGFNDFTPELIDLSELASNLQAGFDAAYPGNSVRCFAPTKTVFASSVLLEEITNNLVENAIEASQDEAEVLVDFTLDYNALLVSVRDFGSGVSSEAKEMMFEPFWSTKRNSSSSGMGLFVVQLIAQRFGGGVEIESSAHGTRVEVKLGISELHSREEGERRIA